MKRLYLDMDGTIADLYRIDGWLERLESSDSNLFIECKPIITQAQLFEVFPSNEYDISILSMTPKGCSDSYATDVIRQKNEWLDEYFPDLKKRIYKKYSYNKNLKNSENSILVDDNAKIRECYRGIALDPATLWG